MRHQEDTLSKATSSLFPIKMFAILKRTQSNVQQNIEQLQTPTTGVTINKKTKRDFMFSLSDNNQTDIIEAFNSTSRYLDDLLNIDNPYFEQMVGQIYPTELQLNKVISTDTEVPFLDLNLSITNGIVSSKIYDKRDDFHFEIVNFPFLDGDVPRSPSYGVYIFQLIRFARVCSNVDDFNNRNLFLTAKLLKQGYRYHRIQNAFSKFYHRHSELIVKYNIGLK